MSPVSIALNTKTSPVSECKKKLYSKYFIKFRKKLALEKT